MRRYVTCSSASRVVKCVPSAVLPQTRSDGSRSAPGSAFHMCSEERGLGPRDTAYDRSVAMIPRACEKFEVSPIESAMVSKMVRSFTWVPPEGALPEVSLAWMRDFGRAMVIPKHLAAPGNYMGLPPEAWIAGTADLIWVDPATGILWVADYKTGLDRNVSPIDRNFQLWSLTLMALSAREQLFPGVKVKAVMPAVIFIRTGFPAGIWETPAEPVPVGGDKLLEMERKLSLLCEDIDNMREAYRAKKMDLVGEGLVTGPHCGFCPAITACPAFLGNARGLLGTPNLQLGKRERKPLTKDEAKALAKSIQGMSRAVEAAKDLLKGYATDNGPIEVDEGLAWGPVEEVSETIVQSEQMFDVLWRHFDRKTFDIVKVSKSKIYDACRDLALRDGKKIAEVNRLVLGELREMNCIQDEQSIEYKLFRSDVKP